MRKRLLALIVSASVLAGTGTVALATPASAAHKVRICPPGTIVNPNPPPQCLKLKRA